MYNGQEIPLEINIPAREGANGYVVVNQTHPLDVTLLSARNHKQAQEYLLKTQSPLNKNVQGLMRIAIPQQGPAQINRFDRELSKSITQELQ